MRSVCIFCGSASGARPSYLEAARQLGDAVAERGLTLVYGGATVGLMGALADAALAKGGRVIGVLPESLRKGKSPTEASRSCGSPPPWRHGKPKWFRSRMRSSPFPEDLGPSTSSSRC